MAPSWLLYQKKSWGWGYSLNLVLKVPKYHEDHRKIKFGAIGVGKDDVNWLQKEGFVLIYSSYALTDHSNR